MALKIRKPNIPRSSLHTAGDGRGNRDVFLDGVVLTDVLMADEQRGIVECCMQPVRVDKHRKRVLTRRLHGVVKVVMRGA